MSFLYKKFICLKVQCAFCYFVIAHPFLLKWGIKVELHTWRSFEDIAGVFPAEILLECDDIWTRSVYVFTLSILVISDVNQWFPASMWSSRPFKLAIDCIHPVTSHNKFVFNPLTVLS